MPQRVSAFLAQFDIDEDLLTAGWAAGQILMIRCIGAALAYGSQVALARLLGASEYGTYALVWVWVLILGYFAPLGFGQTVCRFVPFYRARNEPELVKGFLLVGAAVVTGASMAFGLCAGFLLWMFQSQLSQPLLWALAIGIAVFPLIAMQDFVENTARAFNWPVLAIGPTFILRPALIALGVAALAWAGAAVDAWSAICVTLAAALLCLSFQAALMLGKLRGLIARGEPAWRMKEWFRTAGPFIFIDGTHLIFSNIDILILGIFADTETVAIYFAATRILQIATFAQYAATAATAQRFSAYHATNDGARIENLAQLATAFNVIASGAIALAIFHASPLLLGMFGSGFENGATILTILMIGVVLQSFAGPGEDILNMLGEQKACAAAFLAALAFSTALNFLLIPRFGATGAAAAMTMSVVLRGIALTWLVRSRLGFQIYLSLPLMLRLFANRTVPTEK